VQDCGHIHTSYAMSRNLLIIKPNLWGKLDGILSPTLSPHSFSFRLVITVLENFEYLWDVEASTFLLFCLLTVLQVFFRFKQLVKNIAQRSALRQDSYEWQGVRDSVGKYLGQLAPPVLLKLTPEQG